MRIIHILLLAATVALFGTQDVHAQQKPKVTSKGSNKSKPASMKCHLSLDKDMSNKVTLEDAKAWADFTPLQVIGSDKKTYTLQQFAFTMITMNPLQTQEFGVGNAGIPFLARKAMDTMKPGDTIFLKEVTAKNDAGKDMTISNIVFSIK